MKLEDSFFKGENKEVSSVGTERMFCKECNASRVDCLCKSLKKAKYDFCLSCSYLVDYYGDLANKSGVKNPSDKEKLDGLNTRLKELVEIFRNFNVHIRSESVDRLQKEKYLRKYNSDDLLEELVNAGITLAEMVDADLYNEKVQSSEIDPLNNLYATLEKYEGIHQNWNFPVTTLKKTDVDYLRLHNKFIQKESKTEPKKITLDDFPTI